MLDRITCESYFFLSLNTLELLYVTIGTTFYAMYDCDCGPIENAYVRVCVAVINFAVTVTGRLSYQSRLYIVLIHTAIEKNATTGLYPSIILRSLAKLFLVRNRVYDTQANRCCTRMGACLCVCVSALVVGPAIEATS